MKKIRILLMVFVLILPLSLSSFTTTESGETETETTTEETAPGEETSTEETGETETPTDVTDELGTTDEELEKIAEENKAFLDSVVETITDGALWANILTSITILISIVLIVKDKFGKTIEIVTAALKRVGDLINKKADSETVIGELQKTNTEVSMAINEGLGELVPLIDSLQKANAEVSTSINENVGNMRNELVPLLNSLQKQLDVKEENDKALWTVLTIFMQNVKIPESARTEILSRMNGIKECKGSIYELVTEAQEAINTMHDEKLALSEETPNLNSLLEEVETEG